MKRFLFKVWYFFKVRKIQSNIRTLRKLREELYGEDR
jgi:hypothetical protein